MITIFYYQKTGGFVVPWSDLGGHHAGLDCPGLECLDGSTDGIVTLNINNYLLITQLFLFVKLQKQPEENTLHTIKAV